jgi:hypothetical protein
MARSCEPPRRADTRARAAGNASRDRTSGQQVHTAGVPGSHPEDSSRNSVSQPLWIVLSTRTSIAFPPPQPARASRSASCSAPSPRTRAVLSRLRAAPRHSGPDALQRWSGSRPGRTAGRLILARLLTSRARRWRRSARRGSLPRFSLATTYTTEADPRVGSRAPLRLACRSRVSHPASGVPKPRKREQAPCPS